MSEPLGGEGAARIAYIGPLLSPAEAASLDEAERIELYARLLRDHLDLPVDRLLAVVSTIGHLEDLGAIPLVDALAQSDTTGPGGNALVQAARQVRTRLARRERYARESRTLLRAAHRPPEAEALLRPAGGPPGPDHTRLVRPVSRYDDAPDVAAPTEEP